MAELAGRGRRIETDVLVIGGGVAGLWAATRARALAERVLVVDKGPRDWGGQASMAGGDMVVVLPEEKLDDFMDDLVYYYEGLCEQDVVAGIFAQTYQRFEDYLQLGHRFAVTDSGALKGIPQRGLKHIKCYLSRPFGVGGSSMVALMVRKAQALGIERMGRTLITDLLKEDGRVCGAVGFDAVSGEFVAIRAGAVVLSTGLGGWKISYGKSTATGDAFLMAMRAGAQARNFEFMKVWNVPRLFAWEGQTSLLPLGAKFVNGRGEYFMDRYSPKLGANTDPHYIVRAMAIEALQGRGPFFLDCSPLTAESTALMKPNAGWMGLNYTRLKGLGMDFFEHKLEWMPQLNEPLGGLVTDAQGATGVPGLFAAGTARNFEPGVYIGGLHLATTAVTGFIAGEHAAQFAGTQRGAPFDEDALRVSRANVFAPLGRHGPSPKAVLGDIQKAFFPHDVCILKNERSLQRALREIERIGTHLLPAMGAEDPHHLLKLMEVRGIGRISELILRASLLRTESRAGHFRADYPSRDDGQELYWIHVGLDADEQFTFRKVPVPLQRYPIRPSRFYSENFTYPDVSHLLA